MDVAEAARQMIPVVRQTDLSSVPPWCCRAHLVWMLEQIAHGHVNGGKAHRWLGYVQGCVALRRGATLDELKDLNR